MKNKTLNLLLALAIFAGINHVAAQGTAFTYQGQLQNNGSPANGIYDLKLLIYDSSTGASILAGPVTNTAVAVTNGLFTTVVDFGAGAFTGGSNWLHLGVRTNGSGAFTGLMPRQQLTPTPYAIYAENASAAGLSGMVSLAQLPGAVVTNNEASVTLGSVTASGNSLLGSLAIDPTSQNSGSVGSYSLVFGNTVGSSGEGIASKRGGVSDLEFYTGWGNRMTILHNGNVGINSTNPVATLNVNGGLLVLSNAGFSGGLNIDQNAMNTNNGMNAYALAFGATSGNSGEGIVSRRGSVNDLEFYTDWGNRMTILNNGNVGIGTNSPSQALEVNGNFVLIDGGAAYNGNGTIQAYIGGSGSGSDVQIGSLNPKITNVGFWNQPAGAWMSIACSSITIEGGADLAEPFPISKAAQPISEGDVVVIDEANPGQLKLADQPYDTRVAGVVSGANGINPGIQMHQQGILEGGKNVALTGRVYVQADASNGAIKPGDLLTTSSTPGHAMKVSDHLKAQGAILGKAMTALKEGQGMVLVLVTLQ
jgi:hypothetical protein